ncbi:MAG: hypothetical protein Q4B68_01595 [Bacteroidales bacterium]|nr:hypothetical protein [Bacteroidales bacterium]
MKHTILFLTAILAFALSSCNDDNKGNRMYFQAQMANHVSNVAATEEEPGEMTSDAVVYELLVDVDNMTADVACKITLPDGKMGTIDLRGMALSIDKATGGYVMKQTAQTLSQGTFACTNFAGVLDLSTSHISTTHFSFIVEKHYSVNAVISTLEYTDAKVAITNEATGDVRTVKADKFEFEINPTTNKATLSIKGLDYDGNLGKEATLVYENLDLKPCVGGYAVTAEKVSPVNHGEPALLKYRLQNVKARLLFFGSFEAAYTIDGIGEILATK